MIERVQRGVLPVVLVLLTTAFARGQEEPESRPAIQPPARNLDPDDPLNDLSGRMGGIAVQLESGKSDHRVKLNQTDVIDQLDAMIAALKKKSGS